MNREYLSVADKRPKPRCRRCGRFKGEIYTVLCKDCVEQTLRKLLLCLRRVLDQHYGRHLDEWLISGGFTAVRWKVNPTFTVNERLLRRFLEKLIQEVAEKKDVWLEFSDKVTRTPTHVSEVVSFIYQRCGAELSGLIAEQAVEAISSAPTEPAIGS